MLKKSTLRIIALLAALNFLSPCYAQTQREHLTFGRYRIRELRRTAERTFSLVAETEVRNDTSSVVIHHAQGIVYHDGRALAQGAIERLDIPEGESVITMAATVNTNKETTVLDILRLLIFHGLDDYTADIRFTRHWCGGETETLVYDNVLWKDFKHK